MRKNDDVDFGGMRRRLAGVQQCQNSDWANETYTDKKDAKIWGCIRRLMCGKADRILKLISAGRAGPDVPNAMLGKVRRPFRCNHIRTTVRTRIDGYFGHNLPRGEGA